MLGVAPCQTINCHGPLATRSALLALPYTPAGLSTVTSMHRRRLTVPPRPRPTASTAPSFMTSELLVAVGCRPLQAYPTFRSWVCHCVPQLLLWMCRQCPLLLGASIGHPHHPTPWLWPASLAGPASLTGTTSCSAPCKT